MLASPVATCKMADVNPVDYIAATLRAILDGHPVSVRSDRYPFQRHGSKSSTLVIL